MTIGTVQRRILAAVVRGATLCQQRGRWTLDGRSVNRESCAALWQRGFLDRLDNEDAQKTVWRYQATELGKQVIR